MKTIVEKETQLSKFILNDDDEVQLLENTILIPNEIISCHSKYDCVVYENVSPPEDWYGNKYTFDGSVWKESPDWIQPE